MKIIVEFSVRFRVAGFRGETFVLCCTAHIFNTSRGIRCIAHQFSQLELTLGIPIWYDIGYCFVFDRIICLWYDNIIK